MKSQPTEVRKPKPIERRINNTKTPAKPKIAGKAIIKEQRVPTGLARATAAFAASTAAAEVVKTPTKKTAAPTKVAEKRVKSEAAVKEVAHPEKAAKPTAELKRAYTIAYMLDDYGTDITELMGTVLGPVFGKKLMDPAKMRLAIVDKPFRRTIKGTGDASLDGTKAFGFDKYELMALMPLPNGNVRLYSTNTAVPMSADYDAKAHAALKYTLVPTDGDELNKVIKSLGDMLEAHGIKMDWAD